MKILLIRFSSLGDVVLLSAVIDALKEVFPSADISVLVYSKYSGLYQGDPRLTEVLSLPSGFLPFLGFLRKLRKMSFDVIFDLHFNPKSVLVKILTPAKGKLSYRKGHWRRVVMVQAARLRALRWRRVLLAPYAFVIEVLSRRVKSRHTVELFLEPLKRLGMEVVLRPPRLFVQPEAAARVEQFLAQNGLSPGQMLVGVAPGARWPAKRWTSSGFAQVSDQLLKNPDLQVIFLGDQADLNFTQQILTQMQERPVVATGQFDLSELVAVVKRCRLLVTNDSGLMHIATAVGVPVVAIFGPTHPKLGFSPLGSDHVLLHAGLPCSPCSLHGERRCLLGHRECMERITPETVLDAVRQILGFPQE